MTNQELIADEILDQFITAKAILKEVQERLDDYHEVRSNWKRLASEYVAAYEKENQKEKVAKPTEPHPVTKVMLARLDAIKLQIDTATEDILQLTKSLELPLMIDPEFENPSWYD